MNEKVVLWPLGKGMARAGQQWLSSSVKFYPLLLWGHGGQQRWLFLACKVGHQAETLRFLNRGRQPFAGNTIPCRRSQSAGHKTVAASLFLDDSGVYYGNGTKKITKQQCHTEALNQPLPDFPPAAGPRGLMELPDSHSANGI